MSDRTRRHKISVNEAKRWLSELMRRAEAGDDVVLTYHGRAAVWLLPMKPKADAKSVRLCSIRFTLPRPERPRQVRAPLAARIFSTARNVWSGI